MKTKPLKKHRIVQMVCVSAWIDGPHPLTRPGKIPVSQILIKLRVSWTDLRKGHCWPIPMEETLIQQTEDPEAYAAWVRECLQDGLMNPGYKMGPIRSSASPKALSIGVVKNARDSVTWGMTQAWTSVQSRDELEEAHKVARQQGPGEIFRVADVAERNGATIMPGIIREFISASE